MILKNVEVGSGIETTLHGITKETIPGFVTGNFCKVAFAQGTQPLKQTAQAAAEIVRKCNSQNQEGFFNGALY